MEIVGPVTSLIEVLVIQPLLLRAVVCDFSLIRMIGSRITAP